MYLLDNQQQKASAASASLRETHYFEHSPLRGYPWLPFKVVASLLQNLPPARLSV